MPPAWTKPKPLPNQANDDDGITRTNPNPRPAVFLLSRFVSTVRCWVCVRPWALGRKNWLFAGSLRSGKRAAAIMSLIQSARLNGLDPYAYLRDVLTRLPTHRANEIDQLLPHSW
ncbi:Transposase component [Pseudomonas syringae pv. helianthi]|uniref:Transposase component n=1 Tax=Pseudomonas syringae pv. helianthi TaxID=251654 RepID=A0A0P9RUP3_9PSED|nr:Transposase component [Pseudomonas syringae pv. helianthi]